MPDEVRCRLDPSSTGGWSHPDCRVGADAARLVQLLPLHPGATFSTAASASLAGWSLGRVRTALAELLAAGSVTEITADRYLCRAWSAEHGTQRTTEPDRTQAVAATERIIAYYLYSAELAARLVRGSRDRPRPVPRDALVVLEPFSGPASASAWLRAELPACRELASRADRQTQFEPGWQLGWNLASVFQLLGYQNERVVALRAVLGRTEPLGDRGRNARSHHALGLALADAGRLSEAVDHLEHALLLRKQVGVSLAEADVCRALAYAVGAGGDYPTALAFGDRALRLAVTGGDRTGVARASYLMAHIHQLVEQPYQALAWYDRALRLFQAAGALWGEGNTWEALGRVHQSLRDLGRAGQAYQSALQRYEQQTDTVARVRVLRALGQCQSALGLRVEAAQSRAVASELRSGLPVRAATDPDRSVPGLDHDLGEGHLEPGAVR